MNKKNIHVEHSFSTLSVLATGYLGPALVPNRDLPWDEKNLPLPPEGLVQEILGQPMRRAGRFIKLVCCGALACLRSAPENILQDKKTGIFLATGLGNIDEILPFITQVFKHDGGYPSPNQFANSVSNAAAFYLAKRCDVKGLVLTVSQEEFSFESALWLAQTYLEAGEIELALVGGCDVFTPTVEEYRERMNFHPGDVCVAPMGEGSSWLLLGRSENLSMGQLLSVNLESGFAGETPASLGPQKLEEMAFKRNPPENEKNIRRIFLPGFRLSDTDREAWASDGWKIDDYLPFCGISPTASAFGLTRAFSLYRSASIVHCNRNAHGKPALIAAST